MRRTPLIARVCAALGAIAVPAAALAHPGHIAPVDGHAHAELVVIAVLLALIGAGAVALMRRFKR